MKYQVPKCETVEKNVCNPVTRPMCQIVQMVKIEQETEQVDGDDCHHHHHGVRNEFQQTNSQRYRYEQ